MQATKRVLCATGDGNAYEWDLGSLATAVGQGKDGVLPVRTYESGKGYLHAVAVSRLFLEAMSLICPCLVLRQVVKHAAAAATTLADPPRSSSRSLAIMCLFPLLPTLPTPFRVDLGENFAASRTLLLFHPTPLLPPCHLNRIHVSLRALPARLW